MTLMEKVLQAAEPHMKDKGLTVVDGVIGFNFVGVQLSNGRCHFVYLMREAIPSGDDIFPYGEQMIGMDAWEVAQWVLTVDPAAICKAIPVKIDVPQRKQITYVRCDNCMEEFAQFCAVLVGSQFCCPECAAKLQ